MMKIEIYRKNSKLDENHKKKKEKKKLHYKQYQIQ